jgi:hypothetical protein
MLRHVVMFRWTEDTTSEDVNAIQEGLGGLPGAIPEIRAYAFGRDVGINEGNYDFVVVADFHDVDDYVAYRDHPVHQAIIAERIRSHVAARAAVQFDLP